MDRGKRALLVTGVAEQVANSTARKQYATSRGALFAPYASAEAQKPTP